MTKEEYVQLIRTLDNIEVRGRDNLDKLLASIMFLETKMKEEEEHGDTGLHADTNG